MGEVYRSRDTKLGRAVALKFLPASFTGDPDRVARFRREAQVLASLNHRHIAQIHGLEESDGSQFLVLELVDGESLDKRIARGPIPVEDALVLGAEIAEALEAAHERGIVHRDLKPANIALTKDGHVKVLDFGLARAVERPGAPTDLANSPTITSPAAMTGIGVILGTAAYMAPEQAKGRVADKRSDLWSFGCVVYEMLTGRRAFDGEDVTETLASVLRADVDWGQLPAATPPAVRTLLRRCLAKDPSRRLPDAGAARLELQDALEARSHPSAPAPETKRRASWRVMGLAALVMAGAAFIAGLVMGRARNSAPAEAGVVRLAMSIPAGSTVGYESAIAINPAGTQVVVALSKGTSSQLFLRRMNENAAHPVPGTDDAFDPFFSPDGTAVAFFAGAKLKKVSLQDGVVTNIADVHGGEGGAWAPDGTIVYASGQALQQVSGGGANPHPVFTYEGHVLRFPSFLPDGKSVLVSSNLVTAANAEESSLEVVSLTTGEHKVLVPDGLAARYLASGHLIFQRFGTVLAAPFDLTTRELKAAPVPVLEGVRQPSYTGVGAFACSSSGTCVYVAGAGLKDRTVEIVDRLGRRQPLPLPPDSYGAPRVSPDGGKLALWIQKLVCDISVYDFSRGTTTRLAADGDNHLPTWTPDSQEITYASRKANVPGYELLTTPVSGGRAPIALFHEPAHLLPIVPSSWSPDGRVLAYSDGDELWTLVRSEGVAHRFAESRFSQSNPAFSPDGHWIAYDSDETGRSEVYVQPFPGPGGRVLVSNDGGTGAIWAKNGHELFFTNGDQMFVVDVNPQGSLAPSRPRELFTDRLALFPSTIREYDVFPDGQRFVVLNSGELDRPTEVVVLINWFDELKAKVPVR